MKYLLSLSLIMFFLISSSSSAYSLVPYRTKTPEHVEMHSKRAEKMSRAAVKRKEKAAKRKAKLEQRLEKFKAKMKKKGITAEQEITSVWDDSRFKLGALLLLGAIALGIVGALGILSGLFNFVAGLLALAGIILVIWALVTY
jgi:Flp pilus assembly protein TadB